MHFRLKLCDPCWDIRCITTLVQTPGGGGSLPPDRACILVKSVIIGGAGLSVTEPFTTYLGLTRHPYPRCPPDCSNCKSADDTTHRVHKPAKLEISEYGLLNQEIPF